ncbi:MAG: WD40 repeat domain-containing protein [Thermoguttaceae bacterium]|nr:WD40 repeat domain-containing protein [Thermoguttaceae bacterium]
MAYIDEENGEYVVVDLVKDAVLHRLKGPVTTYMHIALSPDGTRLVTRVRNDMLQIWNVDTGESERVVKTVNRAFCSFSPDGTKIAVTYLGLGTAHILSHTGDTLKTLEAQETILYSHPFWSEDGATVYVRENARISAWNVETGECIRTIPYLQPIETSGSLYFFPGGKVLSVMDGTNLVYFWEPDAPRLLATLMLLPKDRAVLFTPQGHFHGPEGVEEALVYVALTDSGEQLTLTPAEFTAKYGWKNDPARVQLDGITSGGTAAGAK